MEFFKKLFSKESSSSNEPVESVKTDSNRTLLVPSFGPGLYVGKKTDVGKQREQNEDALYTIDTYIQSNQGTEPLGIFIVADGMGGYKKGEIASDLAARTAAKYLLQHIYLPHLIKNDHNASQEPINEVLTLAVTNANDVVLQSVPEAGTTLTIAVIMGNYVYLAHVGDSRAYIYEEGKLRQITKDHSLVARLIELGQATPEEALTHPQRNVLYRALGQSGNLEVETYLQRIPPNSYLFMCSDGLWGMLSDDKISNILAAAATPEDAVNKLIEEANAHGGEDNITAILVGVGSESP